MRTVCKKLLEKNKGKKTGKKLKGNVKIKCERIEDSLWSRLDAMEFRFHRHWVKTDVFLSPKRDFYLSIFPVVHCKCSHACVIYMYINQRYNKTVTSHVLPILCSAATREAFT